MKIYIIPFLLAFTVLILVVAFSITISIAQTSSLTGFSSARLSTGGKELIIYETEPTNPFNDLKVFQNSAKVKMIANNLVCKDLNDISYYLDIDGYEVYTAFSGISISKGSCASIKTNNKADAIYNARGEGCIAKNKAYLNPPERKIRTCDTTENQPFNVQSEITLPNEEGSYCIAAGCEVAFRVYDRTAEFRQVEMDVQIKNLGDTSQLEKASTQTNGVACGKGTKCPLYKNNCVWNNPSGPGLCGSEQITTTTSTTIPTTTTTIKQDTNTAAGWTFSGENSGFATIVTQGQSFSSGSDTTILKFPSPMHALDIRSNDAGDVRSKGVATSDSFILTGDTLEYNVIQEATSVVSTFHLLDADTNEVLLSKSILSAAQVLEKQTVDISAFIGKKIKLRFSSQTTQPGWGWYMVIDDVRVLKNGVETSDVTNGDFESGGVIATTSTAATTTTTPTTTTIITGESQGQTNEDLVTIFEGFVKDLDGAPIPNEAIEVQMYSGFVGIAHTSFGISSDSSGKFSLVAPSYKIYKQYAAFPLSCISDCRVFDYTNSKVELNLTLPIRSQLTDKCVPLIKNGDSKDKLDIVFVGNGYSDFESLKSDAKAHADSILKKEPFKSNSQKINFYVSKDIKDLSCKTFGNKNRCIYCDNSKVSGPSSVCPNDKIIVLHKTDEWIGCATLGGVAVSSSKYPPISTHEFGHSFGELWDEYVYEDAHIIEGIDKAPNCDTTSDCKKWGAKEDWWGNLVSFFTGGKNLGCFRGCTTNDLFRATENSLMKSGDSLDILGFGPLNEKHLAKLINVYR